MASSSRRSYALSPPIRSHSAATTLSGLWPILAVDCISFGLVFPILPLYARSVGLSIPAIGVLVALYALSQFLCAPAWGRVSDRSGRRLVLLIALFGTFVSMLLIALAHDAVLLFVAVAVNGASGGSMAVARAAIADVTPVADRPRAFGMLNVCIGVGFVVGPALAALSALGGQRFPFVVAAVLAGTTLVAGFFFFSETLALARSLIEGAPDKPNRPFLPAPARRVAMRAVLLAIGCSTASFALIETTFSLLGQEHLGFGEVGVGLSFCVLGAVMTLTRLRLVGYLSSAIGPRLTITIGGGFFVLGLIDAGVTRSLVVLGIGIVCLGIGYGLVSQPLSALLMAVERPKRRATEIGREQAVSTLARVVGPMLGAGLFAAVGPFGAYIAGALIVIGAVVFVGPVSGYEYGRQAAEQVGSRAGAR